VALVNSPSRVRTDSRVKRPTYSCIKPTQATADLLPRRSDLIHPIDDIRARRETRNSDLNGLSLSNGQNLSEIPTFALRSLRATSVFFILNVKDDPIPVDGSSDVRFVCMSMILSNMCIFSSLPVEHIAKMGRAQRLWLSTTTTMPTIKA
jgi:hypothetical protein